MHLTLLHPCIVIECTAQRPPIRNVTVQPSQTSLLIEWIETEQLSDEESLYTFYFVVCGTQSTLVINNITVNITGLSVFTRYECCVGVLEHFSFLNGMPTCLNATTAPGMPCGLV